MGKIVSAIKAKLCFFLLLVVYSAALLLVKLCKRKKAAAWHRKDSLLIITTFHNVNWFVSHVRPFSQSKIKKIYLVCDEEIFPMEKVQYVCPSPWMRTILPRPVGKLFLAMKVAILERPDILVGYHMFPNAMIAMVAGAIINRPACFQLTSGAMQLQGGGWQSENPIAAGMKRPSRLLERIIYSLVHCFDLVVVRGTRAKKYMESIGFAGEIAVITGSIGDISPPGKEEERKIDLIFVGRLAEVKRPQMIVEIIHSLKRKLPEIQAAFLGDGPLKETLLEMIEQKGLQETIHLYGAVNDVGAYLSRSKVFLLTSEDEGMSIALLEAMASGVVPVVGDVGDLGDIVQNKTTGFLVEKNDIDAFIACSYLLLTDESLRKRLSEDAVRAALKKSSVSSIAETWNYYFEVIRQRRGGG